MSRDCDANERCAGYNGPKPKREITFWESLFGASDDCAPDSSCTCCSTCGNSKCTCNKLLCDHLRKCAGLGQLPPLIEKCEDIPGYRTGPGRSTCTDKKDCGNEPPKKECCPPPPPKKECCPPSPPKKECCPPPPKMECPLPPPKKECCPPSPPKKDCKAPTKNDCCAPMKKPKFKCPPMPDTDCCDCKPAWMVCPPPFTKMYPVPEGAEVLPISVGGRSKEGKGGDCGQGSEGKPNLNANCPMMKPDCP